MENTFKFFKGQRVLRLSQQVMWCFVEQETLLKDPVMNGFRLVNSNTCNSLSEEMLISNR